MSEIRTPIDTRAFGGRVWGLLVGREKQHRIGGDHGGRDIPRSLANDWCFVLLAFVAALISQNGSGADDS
jgi:hypothetical protein